MIMKKTFKKIIVILMILILYIPTCVMAEVDLSELSQIAADVASGNNVKAWKKLTPEMIEEAFKGETIDVIYIMQALGTNLGSESYYITSKEEKDLYNSLVDKFKSEWSDPKNDIIRTDAQITDRTYEEMLNYMDTIKEYADQEDLPDETTTDDEEITVEADDVFDLEWDKIAVEVYGGQEMMNMNLYDIEKLYDKLYAVDYENLSDEDKQKWEERAYALIGYITSNFSAGEDMARKLQEKLSGDKPLYTNPLFGLSGETAEDVTPDKIIGDAETFVQDGQNSSVATINQTNADTALNSIYNILLAIAISITVIWGLVIAIKLMMSSVEEKAEYKQMLWPYLIGCIVIFGSFIIWRIIIIVMNNVL